MKPRGAVEGAIRWIRARRRVLIAVALLIVFFYVLGYFSGRTTIPGMCLIYG